MSARPNIIDRRNLPGERGCSICWIPLDRLLRLTPTNHRRGDTAESDPDIRDAAPLPAQGACEANLRDRLRSPRSHFSVVVRPSFAAAREADPGDQFAALQEHLFVAGMERRVVDPASTRF